MEDLFTDYFSYLGETEIPTWYSRWVCITSIGALLGRQYQFPFGNTRINPNIYAMLIGSAGTRKSSAIKNMKKLLKAAGYTTLAADRSTKEKFLLDLAGEQLNGSTKLKNILDKNLWGGEDGEEEIKEIFIMAEEFNNFFGNNNIEFLSLLGDFWDFDGLYENRIKNGISVKINNPTVSILGGNTPTGFSLAFPTEILGQGFFSRILLIYGEPNGKRITFPAQASSESVSRILEGLRRMREEVRGLASLSEGASVLLEKIYKENPVVADPRFESYSTRRFTHLLKLCLILSAARFSTQITSRDVLYANTILTHTETLMPKALGEFGKARHSDISHKILQVLDSAPKALSFNEIWAQVASDLEKVGDLATLIQNLILARKIQSIPGVGLLPNKRVLEFVKSDILDYSYLTDEERKINR